MTEGRFGNIVAVITSELSKWWLFGTIFGRISLAAC